MSYKAFRKIREHIEIAALKSMSYEQINEMINTLKHENDERGKAIKGAADYLDTNEQTSIGHGSVFHRMFRDLAS